MKSHLFCVHCFETTLAGREDVAQGRSWKFPSCCSSGQLSSNMIRHPTSPTYSPSPYTLPNGQRAVWYEPQVISLIDTTIIRYLQMSRSYGIITSLIDKTKILKDLEIPRGCRFKFTSGKSPRVGGKMVTAPSFSSGCKQEDRQHLEVKRNVRPGRRTKPQESLLASKCVSKFQEGLWPINDLSLIPLKPFYNMIPETG